MHHRSPTVTLAAVLAASVLIPLGLALPQTTAGAQRATDPRTQQQQVRAEQAKVAGNLNTSKASLSQIDAALATIDDNLRTQESALAQTEAQVAQANQDLQDAQTAIGHLSGELSALRAEMRRRAVASYVSPPGDTLLTVLQTKDFTTASARKFYIELRALNDADVADRLQGAESDLAYQRHKAAAAKATAEAKRAEQARRTDAVRQAKADQEHLASSLRSTINSQIARSLALSKTDHALSVQIAKQQAELNARLAAAQAAAAAAAHQYHPGNLSPGNQNPNGGENGPLPPVSGGGGAGTGNGGISLCDVGGITVNCAITGHLTALLNAARADGLVLSGGGYRSAAQQIALREAHCGSSYYAIYQMPASSCSPPTAPPGYSQHEVGLAIDFNNCWTRGTTNYQWLAGHAASFGFYNLPSEPWHWSTTGN